MKAALFVRFSPCLPCARGGGLQSNPEGLSHLGVFHHALPGGPTFECKSSKTTGGLRSPPVNPLKTLVGSAPEPPSERIPANSIVGTGVPDGPYSSIICKPNVGNALMHSVSERMNPFPTTPQHCLRQSLHPPDLHRRRGIFLTRCRYSRLCFNSSAAISAIHMA